MAEYTVVAGVVAVGLIADGGSTELEGVATELPAHVVAVGVGVCEAVVLDALSAERGGAAGGTTEDVAVDIERGETGSDLCPGDTRCIVTGEPKLSGGIGDKVDEAAAAESGARLVDDTSGDDVCPIDSKAGVGTDVCLA